MLKQVINPEEGRLPCPKCREKISKEASICPFCQSDLSDSEEWRLEKEKAAAMNTGCSFAVILLGFFAIGAWYGCQAILAL